VSNPDASETLATITGLVQYPIKSCAGIAVETAELDTSGLFGDRQFMLTSEDGQALDQTENPRMATLRPRFTENVLTIEAPGAAPLKHEVITRAATGSGQLYGDAVPVVDQGDAAAAWFSGALDRPCRLVAESGRFSRKLEGKLRNMKSAEQERFTAVSPLLLTNEESLRDLNGRLESPIPMDRFRANVIVRGGGPFDEDRWARLSIGGLEFDKCGLCERCPITTTDQQTGDRGREPIRTLSRYRKLPGTILSGICFGVLYRPSGPGTLRLGDSVRLLERDAALVPNDPDAAAP